MINYKEIIDQDITLDPDDWEKMQSLGHEMLKDMFSFLKNIDKRKVWIKPTKKVKESIKLSPKNKKTNIQGIYDEFKDNILPYVKGNIHPCYWAWVEGTGSPFAMLGEMLAVGMNSNGNNGDHIAMYVEDEVLEWLKKVLALPKSSKGALVGGGSMANLTSLIVARNVTTNQSVRKEGVASLQSPLILYTSEETHSCVTKSIEILGLGTDSIRRIPVNSKYQIDIPLLKEKIQKDKAKGYKPFCIVANVGTVKTGAIDPLKKLAKICKSENMWFHIDGAFGVFANLLPEYKTVLEGINEADSIGFDLHKWMFVPYGLGCFFIRNGSYLKKSFSLETDYLATHERGLAAGPEPLSNLGVEMSRGFRALKVWMSIKEHGIDKFAFQIRKNIAQSLYLGDLINKENNLELLSPVTLNIVCFRYNPIEKKFSEQELNDLNKELLMLLHERGNVAPSYTMLNGKYAIRVANVNHRSKKEHFELLVKELLKIGKKLAK